MKVKSKSMSTNKTYLESLFTHPSFNNCAFNISINVPLKRKRTILIGPNWDSVEDQMTSRCTERLTSLIG